MKTSMLIKTVVALAIGAAFPLGANQKVKAPRKHYFAHNWLES
jgi:hypothetical protein